MGGFTQVFLAGLQMYLSIALQITRGCLRPKIHPCLSLEAATQELDINLSGTYQIHSYPLHYAHEETQLGWKF